jgi:hypothetical protein
VTASSKAVILIGSGPSLNRVDPRRFAPHDTIAFNRSYLAWPDWGYAPTYHACLDPRTVAIVGRELPAVVAANPSTRFFFHRDAAKIGDFDPRRVTLCDLDDTRQFATALDRLGNFGNVGAVSLQILSFLGYRKILMVGVDGHYALENNVQCDANHFRDDYAAGRKPLSKADRAFYTAGWPAAAAECVRAGLAVRNASEGTALTCFETIDLARGLDWLAQSNDTPAVV